MLRLSLRVGNPQRIRWAVSLCGLRAMSGATLHSPLRLQSTLHGRTEMELSATADDYSNESSRADHLPSTSVEEPPMVDEDFDEMEAASQETHDLCYAMIAYLRKADPEVNSHLFEKRSKRAFREPVPEHKRRLIHTHGDRSYRRRNNFQSKEEFENATKIFLELGDKLLLLLNKPLMDRLMESAGKGGRDMRSEGVHRHRKLMEKNSWRNFPHRWFKHAPFEVQQLRADMPESAILNTRFYRDMGTIRCLFTLMEPQHPFRERIERRMFEITQHYDPHASRDIPQK